MHRKAFFLFLIASYVACANLGSTEWSAAPGRASDDFVDANDGNFRSLSELDSLEGLLIADEGWFWIRAQIPEGSEFLLADLGIIPHRLWIGEEEVAGDGSGPPRWQPAAGLPQIFNLDGSNRRVELTAKIYLRKGYAPMPADPATGDYRTLRLKQFIAFMRGSGIRLLSVLLGMILFLGIGSKRRDPSRWNVVLSLFGLFTALSFIESVPAFFKTTASYIPWIALTVATRILVPFSVSFWRRSVSAAGKKDPLALALVDWILGALVAAWGVVDALGIHLPDFLHPYTAINPLPYYVYLSFVAALILWVVKSAKRRPNRVSSLLVLVAGILPSMALIGLGAPLVQFPQTLLEYGLPLAILFALIALWSRRVDFPIENTPTDEFKDSDDDTAELEELEELPDLEELPATDQIPMKSSRIESSSKADILLSLRSSLFPDSIPWDPKWDIAAARQGSRHPATGFYDIYSDGGGEIRGFSFMDSGGDDLESLMYAHIVRGELIRLNRTDANLPRMARTLHRKSRATAQAAGRGMKGIIGRLLKDRIAYLPLSMPPLLLKRQSSGKVLSLQAIEGRAANPPLGAANFGESGLRSLNVSVESGDLIVAFTETLTNLRNSSGEAWGIRRLASVISNSKGKKAEEYVSEIINEAKNFAGIDQLEGPLQLLIVRRR